ncbi:MAG: hypothetical protein C5B43_00910 [Verrucomicrobia bacterium]|nr:MAG: hypothetical protein C5B43_00910 [Verrucomicrobiota bacterium]
MERIKSFCLSIGLAVVVNLGSNVFGTNIENKDYLSSWNDGKAKKELIEYVKRITDVKSEKYVKPEDRIAVLDLDGTLMVEEPVNFQRAIAIKRLKELATENADLRSVQPYKSAWEDDGKYYNDKKNHSFVFLKAFENCSHEDYVNYVDDFLKTQKAPYWKVSFEELFYKPSLELVDFLRKNEFEVFVVSLTEEGCIRLLLRNVLGIKFHRVIGNAVKLNCDEMNGKCMFIMTEEFVSPENKQEGKCRNIMQRIGKRPIFAFGNSMGDFDMLKCTKSPSKENFVMILDHDDEKREKKYCCEELLDHARRNGWVVVSMKDDFKNVFNF